MSDEDKKTQPTLAEYLVDQHIEIDSLYRSINYIKQLSETQRCGAILENRAKHLYMSWTSCTARHYQLHQIATAEEKKNRSYFSKRCYESLEENYLNITDMISLWMSQDQTTQGLTVARRDIDGRTLADSNIKLPCISIPTFSGKFTDWATFKDAFVSLVKNRQSLSSLEKLHYLKSSVQGDAHELICNVPLIENNFDTAWTLLETRYSNTRATVNAHLNEIFAIEPLKKESASGLLALRNIVKRNLAALENLGRPTDSYTDILINRLVQNLDAKTQRDWEVQLSCDTDCPKYDEFDKFLLARIRALEALNHVETAQKSNQNQNKSLQSQASTSLRKSKSLTANSYVVTSPQQCPICDQDHKIYKCQKFQSLSVLERFNNIKTLGLCLNCFSANHKVQECPSAFTCRKCKQKHHTMLHRDTVTSNLNHLKSDVEKGLMSNQGQNDSKDIQTHFSLSSKLTPRSIMLATVRLCVTSTSNRKIQVRALLDQGSTWSFIFNQLATAPDAKRTRVTANLSGLGGTSAGTASSTVDINIFPIQTETPTFQTQALVLPKITTYVPEKRIALNKWPHLKNLTLADDPMNDEETHLLIGADLYGALLLNEIKKGGLKDPVAQKTVFGWVLSGPLSLDESHHNSSISVHHCTSIQKLNSSIVKFWEVEEIPAKIPLSPEDEFCESHFASTHSRTSEGRYVVRIPFEESPPQIGQSRFIAERSLERIESRSSKNHLHHELYSQFMTEYETLKHMSRSPHPTSSMKSVVYLPHHPVFREQSQTTKLRVVFNASSKTSNGTSINDHMYTGPKLQSDLMIILSQWRSYTHVFSADIAKMYRQILINPEDRDFQRILWRLSPDLPMIDYRLNTVTYGTRAAPYLALRVIKQLIHDEGSNFANASLVLTHDTFVDDLLFGAHYESQAIQIRNEVIELLQKAQLEPRKWASNQLQLISDIDPSNHGISLNLSSNQENGIKVLGILWNSSTDTFHFSVNLEVPEILTQRLTLSILSQLFDPVGWIAPIIVTGKILMQKTWLSQVKWDDPLPKFLQTEWSNYFKSLTLLSNISLPRWNNIHTENQHQELHGFADASQEAYGAVIYLRTINQSGNVDISLITCKTKVAPLKKLTIPRLELQAALLLARLISCLQGVRSFKDIPVQCWTDSKVVIAWLSNHSSKWKLFVANRVAKVQTLLPTQKWKHVPTESNPADLASRGQNPSDFLRSDLWWSGPEWLMKSPSQWPVQTAPSADDSNFE